MTIEFHTPEKTIKVFTASGNMGWAIRIAAKKSGYSVKELGWMPYIKY